MAMDASKPNFLSDEDFSKSVFEDGGSVIVDMGGVEALSFEALPKGIYNSIVDSLKYGNSKSSGKPMLSWVFEINEGEYSGRKVFLYTSFSQAALRGTKATLMKIDPTTFSGQFDPKKVAESGALLGKALRLRLTVEDGEQGEQNRVQVLGAATAGEGTSSTPGGGDGAFFNAPA